MSRIGKNPVKVPEGVSIDIAGVEVKAKGKLGELSVSLTEDVEISQENDLVWIKTFIYKGTIRPIISIKLIHS